MQRRAAAAFVAFFLIAGAASLTLIATAEEPTFDTQTDPLQQGDTFSAGGTEYTVASVSAEQSGGGGHGGGGGVTHEVVVEWTNDAARYTAEWENNSTVEYDGGSWRLLVESADDPSSFTLVEEINETAILQDDPDAENETVTSGGERYVVIVEDGERTLVPADEYFPEPTTREFSEGQTLQFEGNETTVASVSSGGVTLEWTAPKTMSASAGQQGNLTLSGGQTYYAYFPSAQGDRVVISDNFDALDRFNHRVERFHKHTSGLWGISILSGLTSMLLIAMAYMPSRY